MRNVYKIQAMFLMKSVAFLTILLFGVGQSYGQTYCQPTGNCSSGYGNNNITLFKIDGENSTSINNSTGCSSNGYNNFTSQNVEVYAGQSYAGEVDSGNKNGGAYIAIWVDWDNTGWNSSSDPDKTIIQLNSSTNFTLEVPTGVTAGFYRLRARMFYIYSGGPSSASAAKPCGSYSIGETEDYTINVVEPTPTSDLLISDIFINASPLCKNETYQVKINVESAINIPSNNTNYKIDYSWDNTNWTLNAGVVNGINNGTDDDFFFNTVPTSLGNQTLYVRIRNSANSNEIINSSSEDYTVIDCVASIINVSANPNPLCVVESNQITLSIENVSSTNIGVGNTSYPIKYSLDNSTWINAGYFNDIQSGHTKNFSFNVTPPYSGALTLYYRVESSFGVIASGQTEFQVTYCGDDTPTACTSTYTDPAKNGTQDNTFVVPAGVTKIKVETWGGGGGGGSSPSNNSAGGGGGGGYASKTINVTPYTLFDVSVGAGGDKDEDGKSSIVSLGGTELVKATGGKKGIVTSGGYGGCYDGTNSCIGTILKIGGKGANGQGSGTRGGAGGGGAGSTADGSNGAAGGTGGAGGAGNPGTGKGANSSGQNASNYGGGGSGGYGSGPLSGGKGAKGYVRITCITTPDPLEITSITANPEELCLDIIDEPNEITITVKNNLKDQNGNQINIGVNSTEYIIEYSWDNINWINSGEYVKNINYGATNNYTFEVDASSAGNGVKTLLIRIRKVSPSEVITMEAQTFTIVFCTPDGNDSCDDATTIFTEGTYHGNTSDFTDLPGSQHTSHWLAGNYSGANGFTIENIGYYQFMSNSEDLEFTACVPNCGSLSGIQFYLFEECGNKSSYVYVIKQVYNTNNPSPSLTTSTNTSNGYTSNVSYLGDGCYKFSIGGFTPGNMYYWAVDGYEGADCEYTIQFNSGISVLPVELIAFSGIATQNGNEIFWTTASENNNDYFVLEATIDGEDFVPLATIPGAGKSDIENHYRYLDRNPIGFPTTYYRLKQVDYDGVVTYHHLISVERPNENNFGVIPNPTNSQFTVGIDVKKKGNYLFTISNPFGEIVNQESYPLIKGNNFVKMELNASLAKGLYFIKITNSQGELFGVKKLIKN